MKELISLASDFFQIQHRDLIDFRQQEMGFDVPEGAWGKFWERVWGE